MEVQVPEVLSKNKVGAWDLRIIGLKLGIAVQTFNPQKLRRQRQMDAREFKASLIYIASFSPARAT